MKIFRTIALAAVMMTTCNAMAQWRLGATVGAVNNQLKINTQHQYDWRYDKRWGVQAGVTGQYDFKDWLGVRADLTFQQRGYTQRRTEVNYNCKYRDNYLTLPVMASFSFGGSKLRGFANVGVYGGYLLGSHCDGEVKDLVTDVKMDIDTSVELNSIRDQRWDFGYVGGIGVEYRFHSHWAAQVEGRYYYSVVSKKKQYQAMKDYQYNKPISITAGVYYIF